MKTKLIKLLLCCILTSLLIVNQTIAQVGPLVVNGAPSPPGPISGPTSVSTATSQYSVPPITQGITLHWSLSPGTAGTINASINQATVSWNTFFSGTAQVFCSASNSSGSSAPPTLTVTVTENFPALVSGSISPASQYVSYNKAPAAITSTASTGGNGIYAYQ